MPRQRDAGYHSLVSMVIFKALDLVTGHSRPLDPRPSSYSQRRQSSLSNTNTLASPNGPVCTNWPGVEAPADLPRLPPRTHCLTPTPLDTGTEQSEVYAQAQPLLFKLPPEVLRSIYEEVIGNRILHIIRKNDRLGHTSCMINSQNSQEICREKQCRGLKLPNGIYESGSSQSDLLSLLQTCRKVYTDAVEVLYRSNTLDFDSMESLISFSIAILPKRLDAIQSLQLDFHFSASRDFTESTAYNDPPRWERTWRVIGSMKSLQKLWVWISWHRLDFRLVEESWLVDQLDQVRQLEIFEVSLPSLKGKEVKRKREQLFQVARRS